MLQVSPVFGDPDLFVGCGVSDDPSAYASNSGTAYWQSTGIGVDGVTIDLASWNSNGCASDAAATVSVRGYTNTTFVIQAQTVGLNPVPLYDGVEIFGEVDVDRFDYYSFQGTGDAVTFTVNSVDGDADLYVGCAGSLPDRNQYLWSSTDPAGSNDVVHVLADDDQYCSSGFVAGVYGYSGTTADDDWTNTPSTARRAQSSGPTASYIITATRGSTAHPLLLNMAQTSTVDTQDYVYYQVPVGSLAHKGIKISVAPQGEDTDVDLVVSCSTDSLPTVSHYRWRSDNSYWFPDTVVVKNDDIHMCAAESSVVIGVYGYQATGGALFSIVAAPAAQDLSWINMPFGARLGGELVTGITEYYLVRLGAVTSPSLDFAASASGVSVAVRAMHNASDSRVIPTLENAHWKQSVEGFSGSGTPPIGRIAVDPSDPDMVGAFALSVAVIAKDATESPIYLLQLNGQAPPLMALAETPRAPIKDNAGTKTK